MVRTRRVDSQDEKERVIDELLTRGYELKHRGQYTARVKEKDWGSLPVHVLLVVGSYLVSATTFGVFNLPAGGIWVIVVSSFLGYAGYSRYTAEEIVIKAGEDAHR